jgi:hypothetical protein
LGRDSTNSSIPPSQDSIAAKAKRRADRLSWERSKDRKPGGQPGRKGSGLAPTATPDRTETLPPPGDCSGCSGDLAGAADAGKGNVYLERTAMLMESLLGVAVSPGSWPAPWSVSLSAWPRAGSMRR